MCSNTNEVNTKLSHNFPFYYMPLFLLDATGHRHDHKSSLSCMTISLRASEIVCMLIIRTHVWENICDIVFRDTFVRRYSVQNIWNA